MEGKKMRRISAKHAKPTMFLGRALYDCFGKLLLKEGTKLSAAQVENLEELGVGELFIMDKRVDDVVAMKVKCTKCGQENWWGWWPKKK